MGCYYSIYFNYSMVNITPLQRLWLESRGGRTIHDVMEINGSLFVAMRSEKQWVPVEIPSDEGINRLYRVRTDTNGTRLVSKYLIDI